MKKGQIVAMAIMGIMTVGCTDYDLNKQTGWKGDKLLEISASISETLPTRTEKEPAEGTYYFSYVNSKQTSVKYETTEVIFESGNSTTDLTWDQINTNNSITNKLFILDNVPYINENGFTSSSNDTNKLINLQDNNLESRYNAGPAPTVPGEGNDLLWDTVKVENVSGAPLSPVHFDLEHRMSMLTFKLLSNNDNEINTLLSNPEKVEVKLHRVITEPNQFNRLTGAITNTAKPINENAAVKLDVAEYTPEEGATTHSWIFPPQKFYNTTERPVLAITLTDTEKNQTRTFKGVLPESMFYEGKYEPLEFLSGCHLTITVLLGSWDDLTVNFRPVLVKKWVTYSAKDINAKQVGVYTADELTELIEAYNENPSENNLALWKYGTYDDTSSTWTFYLWKDLTGVTETDNSLGFITEEGKPSFTFKANGHTINGKTVGTDGTLTDNSTTDGGE